jgi:uncharacterized protein (DUF2267 family)
MRLGARLESPKKSGSREEFLTRIAAHFGRPLSVDPEKAARAVFQVLETHVSPGEIEDVIQTLPKDVRALWPARVQM